MLEPRIAQLIISYKEYRERHLSQLCPNLSIYRKGEQALYYLGIAHSNDPNRLQWQFIEAQWQHFLASTSDRRLAFTESGLSSSSADKVEAIKQDGEAGLLCNLAAAAAIRVFCLEPSRQAQYDVLSQKFSDDEIFFYLFVRQVASRKHLVLGSFDFQLEVERQVERLKRWYPDKVAKLNSLYQLGLSEKLIGKPFPEDLDELWELGDVTTDTFITNRIGNALSTFRNEHIVSEIMRVWQSGNSMFAVYGAAHPILQEPALRIALT